MKCCEKCGSNTNMMLHHKDGNRKNNKKSNLQWLCGSCHNKVHNRVKNIKWMREGLVNPLTGRGRKSICGRPHEAHGLCKFHYNQWYHAQRRKKCVPVLP